MKAIIAEIRGNHMIVIAKNGEFRRCKKLPNCDIGDEINISERNMKSVYRNLSAVAASFLILIMLSSGVYAYYTPYSYVSVDINPSLELYVNRFDKVIEVHAFNDEAAQVIKSSEGIKNKNVSDALEQILGNAEEAGYLSKDAENSVMIVVSSGNKKEEADLIDKMSKTSTAVLSNISSDYEVILEKTKVENYKKAKEQNVSPGKVMLADKFKEAKPEINEEEIKHMPLKQAIEQIEKEDKKAVPNMAITTIEKPNEKPKEKPEPKSKVMNIKELIKEKNEDLGNKLEKDKKEDDNRGKDKNKNKDDQSNAKEKKNSNQEDDNKDQKDTQDKNSSKDKDKDKSKDKENDKSKDKDNKK